MSNNNQDLFIMEQLDEALEERQNPDRRKENQGVPEDIGSERRMGDRRTSASKDSEK